MNENILTKIEPYLMVILSRKFAIITDRMTNALLRSGRSILINTAKDFSCSIADFNSRLIYVAEGLPVHVGSSGLVSKAMLDFFKDIRPGDAFLHNSPYHGNTHHADHTILVPVFYKGEHIATTIARAHQADCGNSLPTTYMPFSRDLYEEGALNFPCVRVQRDFKDIGDIIRMIKMRIRVPDQWYGDYLAQIAACRTGEREIIKLCDKYGLETIKSFIEEWQGYGKRSMVEAIRKFPKRTLYNETRHDPVPGVAPEGIKIRVKMDIDPDEGYITLDFTESDDCVPGGFNMSEATVIACGCMGVLNNLDPNIPHNEGAMSRIKFKLRDNCVVGRVKHPLCASLATTNVSDRVVNVVQSCFSKLRKDIGLADGALGIPACGAVISGVDWRRGGAPFVNQLVLGPLGGPGVYGHDGWVTYGIPVCGGAMYFDSIEVDEQRFPIIIDKLEIVSDSGGAGKWRGSPASEVRFRIRRDPVSFAYSADGYLYPAQGVAGGLAAKRCEVWKSKGKNEKVILPKMSQEILKSGEILGSECCGGGGFGNPLDRDPEKVRWDAREGFISLEKAREIYGVVLDITKEQYEVDYEETKKLRKSSKIKA